VAELVRGSYGRLLALLAAPTRDIPAAEDAIADALERALIRWPTEGIPANPEGWVSPWPVTATRPLEVARLQDERFADETHSATTDCADDLPDPEAIKIAASS